MKPSNSLKVNIAEKKAYSYNILIGSDLLENAQEYCKQYSKANKFLIVTNETVWALYKDKFNLSNACLCILKDGEEYKTFDSLKQIIDKAVENRLERKDCIVAFGGGVVGDMAGYAAASYMRGIDFIQIPTTLLAQVDSSVGGKVAINHEHGKNLIGAFYQPKLVLADTEVLKTLDLRQLKTGLAEVLKYALIESSCGENSCANDVTLNLFQGLSFFEFLKNNKEEIYKLNPEILSELVNICCSLKACVVAKDETEKGLRAILNLGHTYAHAIENLTNYTKYTHGEAVAMGMKMALKLSLTKGLVEQSYYEQAVGLIDDYDLVGADCAREFDKEKFYDEMFLDKKAQDGKVRFVLPNGLFTVDIFSDVSKEQVFESLKN